MVVHLFCICIWNWESFHTILELIITKILMGIVNYICDIPFCSVVINMMRSRSSRSKDCWRGRGLQGPRHCSQVQQAPQNQDEVTFWAFLLRCENLIFSLGYMGLLHDRQIFTWIRDGLSSGEPFLLPCFVRNYAILLSCMDFDSNNGLIV
jgi:hypothetical protein